MNRWQLLGLGLAAIILALTTIAALQPPLPTADILKEWKKAHP